ncbi:hypothetical protein, partial [Sulfuricaulis sp.]|uniref:hypothetical protein n=1 Tax=Sulfuricaulis sp. TaxID=2003553 RepID=UPI0025FC8516
MRRRTDAESLKVYFARMNFSEGIWGSHLGRPARRVLSRSVATVASDLLPLGDFACLLLAASLSTLLYTRWLAPSGLGNDFGQALLIA